MCPPPPSSVKSTDRLNGDHARQSHLDSTPIKMNRSVRDTPPIRASSDTTVEAAALTTLSLLDIGDCDLAEIETDTVKMSNFCSYPTMIEQKFNSAK